jgi:hypothetical protein
MAAKVVGGDEADQLPFLAKRRDVPLSDNLQQRNSFSVFPRKCFSIQKYSRQPGAAIPKHLGHMQRRDRLVELPARPSSVCLAMGYYRVFDGSNSKPTGAPRKSSQILVTIANSVACV